MKFYSIVYNTCLYYIIFTAFYFSQNGHLKIFLISLKTLEIQVKFFKFHPGILLHFIPKTIFHCFLIQNNLDSSPLSCLSCKDYFLRFWALLWFGLNVQTPLLSSLDLIKYLLILCLHYRISVSFSYALLIRHKTPAEYGKKRCLWYYHHIIVSNSLLLCDRMMKTLLWKTLSPDYYFLLYLCSLP